MDIGTAINELVAYLQSVDIETRIETINLIRKEVHTVSPFASEPVDCVIWVKNEFIEANDYNPNSVAPPEMELLRLSIESDGYTQPVVAWDREDHFEVIDGFHRTRVGKECSDIQTRLHGYLPLTIINKAREDRSDRVASTIRHNRARGKHAINAMSDIVIDLKRRNWSDKKIGKELGMDPDEVLRLSQISGLAEMFSDTEFSEAWDAADPLNDKSEEQIDMEEQSGVRAV